MDGRRVERCDAGERRRVLTVRRWVGKRNWKSGNAIGGGASAADGSEGASTSGSATAQGVTATMTDNPTEMTAAAIRARVLCIHEWLPACATRASSTRNGWAAKST